MILMNDFRAEPAELRQTILTAMNRVVTSGWYVLGKELEGFEGQWAGICGVKYGIGVGNGMDAIEIALRSLGIGSGDEVITTPMTAFATVLAILRAGAKPVLADIDQTTALLDPVSVERCISNKTKAVLLVHLYGQIRRMEEWQLFCRENNIMLVEDCAQAHLASWRGRSAGSFGSAGAYSFYPTKNLGALGDGGMVMTGDADLAVRAKCLRNYGQSERYHHPLIGLNSRLDELQAAILSERLKWLAGFTERRREIAIIYRNGINNPKIIQLAEPEEASAHVYHLYVVICESRDELQQHLKLKGIQTLIHYPIPIHQQPPCLNIDRVKFGLTKSERHASTCLSLPCHPQLTNEDLQKVIDAVNSF
jgi:dTDP-4-amino-4,6-dideoxygalactose transaminase